MSAPKADYYLLGEDFGLSSPIKQEAPPYLPDPLLPAYNLKPPMPHGRRLPFDGSEHTFGAGPDDTSLRGFDLAESIWSQDSDLTLDDLALESDSASGRSSSASSRWSAAPLTPSTPPHRQLPPTREPAPPPPESSPMQVHLPATPPATEPEPELPDSPAPAYSRDPLEFDPALLASLDPQLLSHPFEAFEDACWASLPDEPPAPGPHSFRSRNSSLTQLLHPSRAQVSLTAHTSFSDLSMATLVPSLPPLPPPPPPPPAYPTSKPLPNLPPPSPRSSAGQTQQHDLPPRTPVVMSFESFVSLDDTPFSAAPPGETVHFVPLRAPVRPRSKSVGGTKTARRLAGAIARLRGRE
ncbi:hypothetical protein EDB85DRAFT_2139288 [Lactarius pseudohatsudake]|nr:hypothetical protein EDB85DRAFT_2139288 [Lactarius pseudohatsudake]